MGAARLFVSRFDREPTGVWSAPGRVNLIGEHTDYNGGYVMPFAISRRTAVAAAKGGTGWTVWSAATDEEAAFGVGDLAPGRVQGWAAYVAGVLFALREAGFEPPAAELVIDSDVPLGTGLSSSAALECAVLSAMVDLGGLDLPRERWPALAQRAENEYVGVPTGIMDQSASTLCRAGHALFLDCRDGASEHIPFDPGGSGLAVLVIDTKAPHRHVSNEYAARRRSCEEAARVLGLPSLRDLSGADLPAALDKLDGTTGRRVRHVVTENERVLNTVAMLQAGRIAGIGPLMTASHASMRDDYEITVPEVDTAVEAALAAGAHGARMTGGGFGGCVLALVDADAVDSTTAAVAKAYAEAGFTPPEAFTATPSAGARRVA
nr:galactokinase [Virgisporangium aliadipatigenens]